MLVEGNEYNIPITKYRTRSYHIPPGVKSHRIPLQQIASLPLTIIAGITTHDASIGSFESAPHNFHHHDVSSAELTLDGAPIGQRLLTDSPNNNYADAYVSLLQATNNFNTDKSNSISYQDYRNNKTLLAWVTTTDLPNNDWPSYFHLKRSGALSLNITFNEPSPTALSVQVTDRRDDITTLDTEQRIRTTESVV